MRRMMATFAMMLMLVPTTVFAQNPTPARSAVDTWQARQNSRLLQQVANAREKSEEQLAKYNHLADTRDKELMQKLSRALRGGGDQTLVEVAVSDLNDNVNRMKTEAKFAREDAAALMRLAAEAYSSADRLISEEEYTRHLSHSRTVNLRLAEPLPVPLTDLLSRARKTVPEHFVRIETIAQNFGEKSWLVAIK